jgi:hypothetical protein
MVNAAQLDRQCQDVLHLRRYTCRVSERVSDGYLGISRIQELESQLCHPAARCPDLGHHYAVLNQVTGHHTFSRYATEANILLNNK